MNIRLRMAMARPVRADERATGGREAGASMERRYLVGIGEKD